MANLRMVMDVEIQAGTLAARDTLPLRPVAMAGLDEHVPPFGA